MRVEEQRTVIIAREVRSNFKKDSLGPNVISDNNTTGIVSIIKTVEFRFATTGKNRFYYLFRDRMFLRLLLISNRTKGDQLWKELKHYSVIERERVKGGCQDNV